MSRARRLTASTTAYILIPILAAVSPLLVLPAITANHGASAWASVAIGQSIGTALATVVELGWGLNGPQRVARTSEKASLRWLTLSLQTKVIALIPASAVAAVAAAFLAPSDSLTSSLVACAMTASALTATWFFLGKGTPWLILATDGLPRLVCLALSAIFLVMGAPLMTYPVLGLLLPSALAPCLALYIAAKRAPLGTKLWWRARAVISALKLQSTALFARAASAVYIALPITLVSIASPSSVAAFAAGERLMRMGLAAVAVVPNAMQAWVGAPADRQSKWSRAKRAMAANAALGFISATIFGLAAPWAVTWVFSGVVTLDPISVWLFALAIFTICTSRGTGGIGLVALTRVRAIAVSAAAGACVGIPAILLGSAWGGVPGAVAGEILAELTVLSVQVVAIRRRLAAS
ncbi:hypothetical protein [Microbacterium oleivorans]|uniref:Polysaccharide biosynthesis protein n=1 Tax=Microbacterium oleivorans TaxID=273677 RepID=A0A031FXV3_9MICO|nr:hypothetical protein [Microbacterium oleivorans]EZP29036.1 Polysaccharide biosynthesis protein [Microbacterium oleivorans]